MFLVTNENMGLCLCIIEVDCSLGQFESAKLKDKEYSINFTQHCKKEREGCAKFLTFFGK